jgi:hypothetical protein
MRFLLFGGVTTDYKDKAFEVETDLSDLRNTTVKRQTKLNLPVADKFFFN